MDVRRILVILLGLVFVNCVESVPQKVCLGTSTGISHTIAMQNHAFYKLRYENCTIVNGNLELVWLLDQNYNLGFLRHIQEVTGYVIIFGVASRKVPLSSLRIIRGKDQFKHHGKYYSLYVGLNYKKGTTRGLTELQLTSLHEILSGDVFFYDNPYLCHVNRDVNWDDILAGEGAQVYSEKTPAKDVPCGVCYATCNGTKDSFGNYRRHCWGTKRKSCQRLTKLPCSPQCDSRCYGLTPRECCHPECAGGCTGPSKKECWACKNFNNDGECVPFCPPQKIYDQKIFKMVPNPKAKYTYDTLCATECPKYLVHDQGACVKECGAGKVSQPNEKNQMHCMKCDGPCPKACNGTPPGSWVNSNNVHTFTNCTYIKGNIRILSTSFSEDSFKNVSAMEPKDLQAFENVKEISGYLLIQSDHPGLKDLSFLRSLETVHGRNRVGNRYGAFSINATPLLSLGLSSLKSIKNGPVVIVANKFLCYAYTINWDLLIEDRASQRIRISENKDPKVCNATGQVCHSECTKDGCWGPGDHECLRCKNFRLGKRCLGKCSQERGLYEAGNKQCAFCNKECRHECTGPGSDKCIACKNAKDGPYCVHMCPKTKYADEKGICQSCHRNCENHGCSGPLQTRGENGCNGCSKALVDDDNKVIRCLPLNSSCGDGFFKSQWSGMEVCKRCHEQCLTCIGAGLQFCEKCKNIRQAGQCVQKCYADYYVDRDGKECKPCSALCRGCTGPTSRDCRECRVLKVYLDLPNENGDRHFNCTEDCPASMGHKVLEGTQEVCANEAHPEIAAKLQSNNQRKIGMIIGVVLGVTIILGVALALFGYYCQRRAKAKENALKLTARMSGLEESEPLTPTDARPDMASLRLVKESELRRGNIIGSGAFGTVYKGVWIPDGENVKIPVAIKVLQEGTSPSQNKELLEEARVMASVEHPCCVRILAVCMTAQMMLITQLMPLGCLLDYVRKNKNNIGSKALLNWCTQIARGMGYLEERGIVHRDLAARNVLVQSPAQVKITDFGLAKLLDINEEEYHASGGKMPIKWLALECIQHRIFTHKSDVWSYGVTIWELFTYGQRPYENVRARDVPDILEKGERLCQPSMCTIDVYMIMIKCWMLDAESRPSFSELAEEFAKMARDPGRYLAIEGDRYYRRMDSNDSAGSSLRVTFAVKGKGKKEPVMRAHPETGDKYMRLPSQSYEPHDLLRGISVADTPGQIVEAEDYLQPQPSPHLPPESPPPYSPGGPMSDKKPLMVREPSQPYDGQAQHPASTGSSSREGSRDKDYFTGYRRDKKYGNLEAAAAKSRHNREAGTEKRARGDSVNSRYCPDPCKVPTEDMKDKVDDDLPDAPAPPRPLEDPAGGSKPRPRRLELPVDEDDYLQPKSSNPAAYMDLIADKDEGEENQEDKSGSLQPYLDAGSAHAIDNPEYFENVDNGPVKHEQQPLRLRTMSTESEGGSSEHDYYNEYDRLKREKRKKPQKAQNNSRTESTV